MSKNKKNKNERFYTGFGFGISLLIIAFMGFGIFLFMFLYPPARLRVDNSNWWMLILDIIVTVIFPVIIIIVSIRRYFRLVIVDEKGMNISLFKVFRKQYISWDEIKEILFAIRPFPCVFVSKREELYMFNYDKLVDRKGVVQIMMNKKVYRAITKYYDKPITNLTEEMIEVLGLNKDDKPFKKKRKY